MTKIWKNSLGTEFNLEEVISIVKKFPNAQIHVGTDSHFKTGNLIYASVIAIYQPGECAKYFFKRKKNNSKKINIPLKSRLMQEVQDSIEIADTVRKLTHPSRKIFVHADVSENKKNKSNVVCDQVKNWIFGMGFEYKLKPISWASSSIADLHAK